MQTIWLGFLQRGVFFHSRVLIVVEEILAVECQHPYSFLYGRGLVNKALAPCLWKT